VNRALDVGHDITIIIYGGFNVDFSLGFSEA
jgi:hypothetical protein